MIAAAAAVASPPAFSQQDADQLGNLQASLTQVAPGAVGNQIRWATEQVRQLAAVLARYELDQNHPDPRHSYRAGGCLVTINPGRGTERTRDDIAALGLPILAGEPEDLAGLVPAGSVPTTLTATDLGNPVHVERGSAPCVPTRPGIAVRMLTSGTTGPPKRVDLTYETLERVLVGAKHYESSTGRRRCDCGAASPIVNSPLVHLGGLFRDPAVRQRRSLVLPPRAVHGRRAGPTPCAATARRR